MANPYVYLDQLSTIETFELLTTAAKLYQGKYLDEIKILLPAVIPFQYITMEVPDPYSTSAANTETFESKKTFETLVRVFKEISGRSEAVNLPPGNETRFPLLEGITWLILKGIDEQEEQNNDHGDQYLLATRPLPGEAVETLFKTLNFHATSLRVASIDASETHPNHSRYFFHLKDDHQRKSSFAGFAAGELSEDLAALIEWPAKEADTVGTVEFFYLGKLPFYKQEHFTARKVQWASFNYMELKESRRGLERLQQAVKDAKASIGYRLELRTTRHMERSNLERLNEQKARIEYNLAYLSSLELPRPVLMRFTLAQLPALAAAIRGFPMKVIREGGIKYGFQATAKEPTGFHFLLFNPRDATRIEPDPLILFQEANMPHMRFLLDPFWARYYFEGGGDALVFVPEGCSLFPPIHDWERGNMDCHLREMMEHWFKKELKEEPIPDRPIYIFDGQTEPDTTIEISILDQDRMEPLHTRLAWLNDNLLLHHTLDQEGRIKEMAQDISWITLAETLRTEAEAAKQTFSAAALEAGQHIAETTTEMTEVLGGEIERVIKETFRTTEKIKIIDTFVGQWDTILSEMEELLEEARKNRQKTSVEFEDAKNEFWRMEQQIEWELNTSEKRRREMDQKITEELRNLKITRKQLLKKLRSFKF